MIRLHDVRVSEEARSLVDQVLTSGQLAQGRLVAELEDEVAHLSEAATAVAVSSATVGLQLVLQWTASMGNVIVPAVSFPATANAVLAAGLQVRFADVDDDGLMDVQHAQSLVDGNTVAVMPVHLFGRWADTLAYPVSVVEDAAQAIGLPVNLGVISLYGTKTVGAGEGGIVVTSDPELDEWLRTVRNQGSWRMFGLNHRLTDLQAAVALGQLAGIEWRLETRRRNAHLYLDGLAGIERLRLPTKHDSTWHLFTVRTPQRDQLRDHLKAFGIQTGIYYYKPLTDLPWLPNADVPNARQFTTECLQLPVHEHLIEDDIQFVVDCVRGFYQ